MIKRFARHAIVASVLVSVAGFAAANSLRDGILPYGGIEILLLESMPVLQGDLGEIVVVARRGEDPAIANR